MSVNGVGHTHNRPVTVLVVDDHRPVREAMREVVEAADGFEFAGEASSGGEALSAAGELSPAMVIMDGRMSGMGGAEAARLLTARDPHVVVLLVSVEELDAELVRSCGAAAFAHKRELSARLLREVWRQHGTGRDTALERQNAL
jgi:DNA-binding NarL/FixJ family response regulator